MSRVFSSRQLATSQTLIALLTVTSFLPSALKAIKVTPKEAMNEPCPPLSVCSSRPVITSYTFTELLPAVSGDCPLNANHRGSCRLTAVEIFAVPGPVCSYSLIVLLRNVAVASRRPSGLKTNRVAPKSCCTQSEGRVPVWLSLLPDRFVMWMRSFQFPDRVCPAAWRRLSVQRSSGRRLI